MIKNKLKIPFYRQSSEFTCGPASLQMIFSFLGKFKKQDNLIKILHTDPKTGTRHLELINIARREKFFCYVNNNSTIHEVRHFINLRLPVVVNYNEPSTNDGHYAVVVGYDRNKIILNDPWNGKNFKMRENEFILRWHDYLNKHTCKKWIMVVSKKDFHLGKQYFPYSHSKKLTA